MTGVQTCALPISHTSAEINTAIDNGVTDIGENKVQEILDKYDKVKPVRWHMIGHLQSNKVKYIVDKVDLIHSVDSLKLAKYHIPLLRLSYNPCFHKVFFYNRTSNNCS